jgi:hypothetical protein
VQQAQNPFPNFNRSDKLTPSELSIVEGQAVRYEMAVAAVTAERGPRPAPGKAGSFFGAYSTQADADRLFLDLNLARKASDWDRAVRDKCAELRGARA